MTGSPSGKNYVRIERIADTGGNLTTGPSAESNQFAISGRVWNGQRPTAVEVERATFSRTVEPTTGLTTTRIDAFASSAPSASVCFRESLDLVGGTECLVNMTREADKFYGQHGNAPFAVPPYLVLRATDPGRTTPTLIAQALSDVLKVTKAQYTRNTGTLTIEALSSDEAAPPKITAVGLGVLAAVPGTIGRQMLQVLLPGGPPAFVTLVSAGGGRQTEPVTVLAAAPVNRNPVANPDSATTPEDTAVTVAVLGNDSDPDGNPLTVTGIPSITGGSAIRNADGTVTFTPALNFNGTADFTYVIADGSGGTASANVAVTVTAVNDPPVAQQDSATTTANTPVIINVLANDSDVDGDALTVTAVTQPGNDTTSTNGATVTYTPASNFTGTNTFSYTVRDPAGLTATATVTVTVQAAPVSVDLDIAGFSVPLTGRVGRRLGGITLSVDNGGTVNQPRTATLTGTQLNAQGAQAEVYRQSIQVSDRVGGRPTQFTFPRYTPTSSGTIEWRVEIIDDNADADVAFGTTTVSP